MKFFLNRLSFLSSSMFNFCCYPVKLFSKHLDQRGEVPFTCTKMVDHSSILFYALIGFTWFQGAWVIFECILQLYVMNSTPLPSDIDEVWTEETYSLSCSYYTHVVLKEMFQVLSASVIATIVLYWYVLLRLWKYSKNIIQRFGSQESEVTTSIIFVIIMTTFACVYLSLFEFYHEFVIQETYGLNSETILEFLMRNVLRCFFLLVPRNIFMTAVLPNIIAKIGDEYVFLGLWLITLIENLVGIFCASLFKYLMINFPGSGVLSDGELKSQIDQLASRANFPDPQIYVDKTSKVNARCVATGVIILSHGLIDLLSTNETLAVVAHEIDHAKSLHSGMRVIYITIEMLFPYLIGGLLYNHVTTKNVIYSTFKFDQSKPLTLGLIFIVGRMVAQTNLVPYIFWPNDFINHYLYFLMRRDMESEADAFSVSSGYGKYLRTALMKIDMQNLIIPVTNWFYSVDKFDHRTLVNRLREIPG